MSDIISLILPFFGLIFLGFLVARFVRQPIEALGWMNVFVIYVALPALFFQLLSKTPIEQLTEWKFIFGSVFSTFLVFLTMFLLSLLFSRGEIAESTIRGLAAAYGNIGYMGPGLAILALGEQAAVPVALIFCFENMMHFTLAPTLMALSGKDQERPLELAIKVVKGIVLHPFIIATALGVLAAWFHFRSPVAIDRLLDSLAKAAAPCALFAEVHGSDGMVAAENQRAVSIELANATGYTRPPLHDFFMTRYTEAYANEIAAFIASVVKRKKAAPSGEDGLIALVMAEAALRSVKENRTVKLSEVLGG